jgi:CBS domain-containing protein
MSQFPLSRIQDFVRRVAPFEALSSGELSGLVTQMGVTYHPRGDVVVKSGGKSSEALYIIQSGSVKLSVPDEDGQEILIDIRGEGDTFGALSLLQGRNALLNVTVKEDLIAFVLPRDSFLPLIEMHPEFQRHFSFSLARRFRAVRDLADEHLGRITGKESLQEIAAQMRCKVSELMSSQVLCCGPDTSIQDAAQRMAARRVGSILVCNGDGESVGMVTDTDLRSRALAQGMDYSAPISGVMSSPVIGIPPSAFVFEAVLEMALQGVHHLVVREGGRTQGLISDHDIKLITGASPVGLLKEVDKVGSVDKLARLAEGASQVLEMLVRMGSSAEYMMALLNGFFDRLTKKIMNLSENAMAEEGWGAAPCEYSWLFLGAQARKEQAPPPKLEDAIVYQDVDPKADKNAQRWFLELAGRTAQGLEQCGLSYVQLGIQAHEPQWCLSHSAWQERFNDFLSQTGPMGLGARLSLFDMRAMNPADNLVDELREMVIHGLKTTPHMVHQMIRPCMAVQAPLGFLREFVVERDGGYSDSLHLGKRVIDPVVSAVRVLALDANLSQTGTLERIKALEHEDILDPRLSADLLEAFNYTVSLLISRYLETLTQGRIEYALVDPSNFNSTQRKMLKECFVVIEHLCQLLRKRYGPGSAIIGGAQT